MAQARLKLMTSQFAIARKMMIGREREEERQGTVRNVMREREREEEKVREREEERQGIVRKVMRERERREREAGIVWKVMV
jgi:hypothetical protein